MGTIPLIIFKADSCAAFLVANWLVARKPSFSQMTMKKKVSGLLKLNMHPAVIQILHP